MQDRQNPLEFSQPVEIYRFPYGNFAAFGENIGALRLKKDTARNLRKFAFSFKSLYQGHIRGEFAPASLKQSYAR